MVVIKVVQHNLSLELFVDVKLITHDAYTRCIHTPHNIKEI
jgi:hypothetical protein